MTTTNHELRTVVTDNPDRADLERRADYTRSRLARTLAALDRRRHQMTDVGYQLRAHWLPLAVAGGVLVLGVVGSTVASVLRARARRQRMMAERASAVKRLWQHPERIGRAAGRPLLEEIGRRVLVGVLTFAATELARRAIKSQLPAPQQRAV